MYNLEIETTTLNLNDIINKPYTYCYLVKGNFITNQSNSLHTRINSKTIFPRSNILEYGDTSWYKFIGFYSIHIDANNINLIDKLDITIGNKIIWSIDFKYLLSISKYIDDSIYIPDNFFFENTNFISLLALNYHQVDFTLVSKENINYQITFITMSPWGPKLICGTFWINTFHNVTFNNLPLILTKGVHLITKDIIFECKLKLFSKDNHIHNPIKCRIFDKNNINVSNYYQVLHSMNYPTDVIKHILSFLVEFGLYYVQFDSNNSYLDLSNYKQVELELDNPVNLKIISLCRNVLICECGMGKIMY